jgi:putative endonuclease
VALVYVEAWPDKGEALRQERLIKKLRKSAKECLAASFQGLAADPSA